MTIDIEHLFSILDQKIEEQRAIAKVTKSFSEQLECYQRINAFEELKEEINVHIVETVKKEQVEHGS